MNRTNRVLALAAAASLAVLTACSSSSSSSAAGSGATASSSGTSSPNQASVSGVTLHIGDQAGTGAQALLTAAGLIGKLPFKVSWSDFTSGPPMLQAMGAGSVDIGGVGNAPPVFAAAGGSKIAIVGAYQANPLGSALLVPKGSPITSVAQLKGKRIAVAQGSSADYHRIGLIATASTSYTTRITWPPPVRLAGPRQRRAGGLEHRHHGRRRRPRRTSARRQSGARERYRRAAEFPTCRPAVGQLGGRRGAGRQGGGRLRRRRAGPRDRPPGRVLQGPRAAERARSPQGRPLLVQAGSSQDGREFAARYAEAVFTGQQTLGRRAGVLRRPEGPRPPLGRDPDQVKILPGLVPGIGSTEAEARALEAELDELIIPEYGLAQLAKVLGETGGAAGTGPPLPEEVPPGRWSTARKSRFELVTELARRDGPHGAPAHRPARRRPRAPDLRRDAGAGGGHDRAVVRGGRRRRVQRDAAGAAVRAGALHRARDPAAAPSAALFRTEYPAGPCASTTGIPRLENVFTAVGPEAQG